MRILYHLLTFLTLINVTQSTVCIAEDDRYDGIFCMESFPDLNSLVRVKYRREWYSICADVWSKYGADTVCMQHNHIGSYAKNVSSEPVGVGTSTKLASIDWECMDSCRECENCIHIIDIQELCTRVARVHCQDIRLTRNHGPRSGMLEQYVPNKHWGSVCSLQWNKAQADVACNQLYSCPAQEVLEETKYRGIVVSSQQINVRAFNCSGHEASLSECTVTHGSTCAERDQRRAGLICRSNCTRPTKADNVLIHPDREDYAPFEQVTISCASGYRSQSEETVNMTCHTNCSWAGPQIECKPVCDPPGEVQNGTFAPQQTLYYFGMSVNFTCQEHFKLKGFSKLTCREDRTWSHKLPECLDEFENPQEKREDDDNGSFSATVAAIVMASAFAIALVFIFILLRRGQKSSVTS